MGCGQRPDVRIKNFEPERAVPELWPCRARGLFPCDVFETVQYSSSSSQQSRSKCSDCYARERSRFTLLVVAAPRRY